VLEVTRRCLEQQSDVWAEGCRLLSANPKKVLLMENLIAS
jgi:hypothetical protein